MAPPLVPSRSTSHAGDPARWGPVAFLATEAGSALLLLAAALVALVWANSPWSASYRALWETPVRCGFGPFDFDEDLAHVVNDALMALFFLVVGMEIKRELVVGELRDPRRVAVPVLAAFGGMVVPAATYALVNRGGPGAAGWGIPMATDIAFAVGVVAALGRRVPPAAKLLLLTLAIVDDLGAIAVIAVFYADAIRPAWLLASAAIVVAIWWAHRRRGGVPLVVFVVAGVALWMTVYESGVHATVAGVVFGLLVPARARIHEGQRARVGPSCDRWIRSLHPWTALVVIPLFALANAGVEIRADVLRSPTAVFVGVLAGLVVGKFVGVTLLSWLAVRLGLGHLGPGVTRGHVAGLGSVAGIGFTVSLFVAELAFDDPALQDQAKLATLVASVVAALVATATFAAVSWRRA